MSEFSIGSIVRFKGTKFHMTVIGLPKEASPGSPSYEHYQCMWVTEDGPQSEFILPIALSRSNGDRAPKAVMEGCVVQFKASLASTRGTAEYNFSMVCLSIEDGVCRCQYFQKGHGFKQLRSIPIEALTTCQ